MQSLWFLWDIVINALEMLFMYRLFNQKLGYNNSKKKFVILFLIVLTVILTILNYSNINLRITMFVITGLRLLYALFLFNGTPAMRIMWASAASLVFTITNLIIDIIMMNINFISVQEAGIPSLARFLPTTIYIIICAAIFFILMKFPKMKINLPISIQVIIIVISIACTVLAGQLQLMSLDPTFSVPEQNLHKVMTFALSIFLFAFFITIHKTGEYMYSNAEHINQIRSMEIESKNVKQLQTVLSAWNHDQHHHIAILSSYAKNNETDKIQEYLSEMQRDLDAGTAVINTGNQIIDIILSNNFAVCQAEKIRFKVIAKDIGSFPISDTELSSLIGNIMDNAIEACRQCLRKNKEAFIDLRIYRKQQMIFIYEVNSSLGEYVYKNNELISSSDTTGHGYGLKRIKKIVKNANGFVYTEPLKDVFKIELCVPDLDANGG